MAFGQISWGFGAFDDLDYTGQAVQGQFMLFYLFIYRIIFFFRWACAPLSDGVHANAFSLAAAFKKYKKKVFLNPFGISSGGFD